MKPSSTPRPPQGASRPRKARAAALLLASLIVFQAGPSLAGKDWLPPKHVSAIIPSVTLAPGQPRVVEFLLRANGAPANLRWTLTPAGAFVPILSVTEGTVSLVAGQTAVIPVTVTVPASVTAI